MKKKEYEKIQKKEKVKTILKWVFACLGWTLLATATISLMVVGIKGCANSNKSKSTSSEVQRDNQPSRVVNNDIIGNGLSNIPSEQGYNMFQGIAGFSTSGDLSLEYHWTSDGGTYAPWYSAYMSEFNLQLTTNTERYRLFTMYLTDSSNNTNSYNVYRVYQSDEEGAITFYYYNNGYGQISIDDRDFDFDYYTAVDIIFPRYNADWVKNSNDYVVVCSFVYYNYDNLIWGSLHSQGHLGCFADMFTEKNYYVNSAYGWQSKSTNQGVNEAGGNTNNGGSGWGDGTLYGVFSLLAQAFTSLAGLMSIVIIPGVTIGTLIVLPLVVTLIIFIVSLFKR